MFYKVNELATHFIMSCNDESGNFQLRLRCNLKQYLCFQEDVHELDIQKYWVKHLIYLLLQYLKFNHNNPLVYFHIDYMNNRWSLVYFYYKPLWMIRVQYTYLMDYMATFVVRRHHFCKWFVPVNEVCIMNYCIIIVDCGCL